VEEKSVARERCGVSLTLPVGPDGERSTGAARLWFERCPAALGGRLAAAVRSAPPELLDFTAHRPGGIGALVSTAVFPPDESGGEPAEWTTTHSAPAWQELVRRLGEMPSTASFEAWTWDANGGRGNPEFSVAWSVEGEFAELFSSIDDTMADDPAGQRRILATVREVAEVAAPVAVAVADRFYRLATPLEAALNRYTGQSEAGSVLRNYGWLTVLSDEMTERVGGLERLRASGAFVEADRLAGGGSWLLATETWDDYGPEQANRLFELLAPVLPSGRPHLVSTEVVAERDPREITG
jgi:hypothetical protein